MDLQDLIYTTTGVDNIINFNSSYLYIPTFIPGPESQRIFNESIKKVFSLTFDSRTSKRTTIKTGSPYQPDIGSSSATNSLEYLIVENQAEARAGPADKPNNIGNSDHVDDGKVFVEIDGIR